MDRISKLPDDILLSFMDRVEWKQAAKTSILSKRWRYLWAKRTHLHFNHLTVLPELDPNAEENIDDVTADEKSNYINWVNQVVDVHCGPWIDTFKVCFHFDKSHAHHIDKWLRFALFKQVKDLELNLISFEAVYTFESDILLKPLLSTSDIDVSFLKSLHFTNINVSGDVLEFLLSRCRLLERLDITASQTLVRLKVIGLSCKLKQLIINDCVWYHDFSNLRFKSVPVLHEVKIVTDTFPDLLLPQISCLASQLYKFYLGQVHLENLGGPWPTLSNLKHLCLQIDNLHFEEFDEEFDLVALTNILEACPVLCEFKLEIFWASFIPNTEALNLREQPDQWAEDDDNNTDSEGDDDNLVPQEFHPNLKVLHVVGFNGCHADVDLILYIADYATYLDTIICDSSRCDYDWLERWKIEESRNRASKLIKILPPTNYLIVKVMHSSTFPLDLYH